MTKIKTIICSVILLLPLTMLVDITYSSTLPTVAIVTTGGTIAEKIDPATHAAVPAVSGVDLIKAVPQLKKLAKGEIVSSEWEEFDLANSWWTIPAHKAKNGNTHLVPLPKLALKILQKIKVISSNSKWLFPSPNSDKHITPESIDHAIRRSEDAFKKIKHFTPHDLRRTAASLMTALGISRLVVSKLLNHVENSVTAIYDRHSYDKEKKQAMDKWGIKLRDIISKNTR